MRSTLITDDRMIRRAIRSRLADSHAGEDAVIVDELKVSRGSSRMDVAVVNGRLEGYEIKSDRDTLDRLPKQARLFGLVADRMTLVTGERHLDKAKALVPDWWAIQTPVEDSDGGLHLRLVRRGRLNRGRDSRALLEVLERAELLGLLAARGIDKGMRSANYAELVQLSITHLSRTDIADFVKRMLKVRASVLSEFGHKAFGRSAIICSKPSE